jgi:GNAT superfamily N-acetyltransferase
VGLQTTAAIRLKRTLWHETLPIKEIVADAQTLIVTKSAAYNQGMLTLRRARREDVPAILQLIRALAEFEREPKAAVATEADLLRDGFDAAEPKFHVILADWYGEPCGFAFYFFIYSTWLGRPGLYLEDLFVKPEFRGRGIGKALLAQLAAIAKQENCYGMRWQVLDWNEPAIRFYKSLGGEILKEWLTVRLKGEPMDRLAALARAL